MPVTTFTTNISAAWGLARTNSGFQNATQLGSTNFNLLNLNTATYNQLLATQYTLASSATQTIDLTSLTNLVGESFTFTTALTFIVLPSGSECTVSPGASNPLQWFFGGTSQSVVIPSGGVLAFSDPAAGPGVTVDGTHKTLKLLNSGATSLTVTVVILGSA